MPAPPRVVVWPIGTKHLHHRRAQALTPVVQQSKDQLILLPADEVGGHTGRGWLTVNTHLGDTRHHTQGTHSLVSSLSA